MLRALGFGQMLLQLPAQASGETILVLSAVMCTVTTIVAVFNQRTCTDHGQIAGTNEMREKAVGPSKKEPSREFQLRDSIALLGTEHCGTQELRPELCEVSEKTRAHVPSLG